MGRRAPPLLQSHFYSKQAMFWVVCRVARSQVLGEVEIASHARAPTKQKASIPAGLSTALKVVFVSIC